jgi:NADH:ubiquinone oxidoreductase subunit C
MLADMLGTDTGEGIELTYHLRSFARDEEIYVKANVAYDAEITSVWNIYPAALLPERETAELLGLTLAGHPNPRRLFTTDGVPPLLRKDQPVRTVEEVRDR